MNSGKDKNFKTPQSVTSVAVKVNDFSQEKGFVGTIIFHALLFLCVFLMSFAGGSGNGDNGTGEALGGIEVSLGEPDLGGTDAEAGYPEETVPVSASEQPEEQQTLTEDNADAPIMESKEVVKPKVTTAPKISQPKFKEAPVSTKPVPKVKSGSLFNKSIGNKGSGSKPGNEGRDDGSIYGDPDGNNGDGKTPGNGNGDGKPGDGDGPLGPGKGPGIDFDLSGFRRKNEFDIVTNRSGAGTVKIEICVFPDGRLKSAKHRLGGTMTDKYFIDLALKAVRENTYIPTGTVTSDKCGVVTFTFKAR